MELICGDILHIIRKAEENSVSSVFFSESYVYEFFDEWLHYCYDNLFCKWNWNSGFNNVPFNLAKAQEY